MTRSFVRDWRRLPYQLQSLCARSAPQTRSSFTTATSPAAAAQCSGKLPTGLQ